MAPPGAWGPPSAWGLPRGRGVEGQTRSSGAGTCTPRGWRGRRGGRALHAPAWGGRREWVTSVGSLGTSRARWLGARPWRRRDLTVLARGAGGHSRSPQDAEPRARSLRGLCVCQTEPLRRISKMTPRKRTFRLQSLTSFLRMWVISGKPLKIEVCLLIYKNEFLQ